jgi:hypothetical protein
MTTSAEDIAMLRLKIADPAGASAFLTDAQLEAVISDAGGDLDGAASECWRIKAANVADWYQASLDGAFLSREQVFDHCMRMAETFQDRSSTDMINVGLDSGGGGSSADNTVDF